MNLRQYFDKSYVSCYIRTTVERRETGSSDGGSSLLRTGHRLPRRQAVQSVIESQSDAGNPRLGTVCEKTPDILRGPAVSLGLDETNPVSGEGPVLSTSVLRSGPQWSPDVSEGVGPPGVPEGRPTDTSPDVEGLTGGTTKTVCVGAVSPLPGPEPDRPTWTGSTDDSSPKDTDGAILGRGGGPEDRKSGRDPGSGRVS